jgi:peroxiredoxin Q/BCP
MPTIGDMAPDFELLNDEGKRVKLSDYRGKKVVLYFYPKDFTSGCELQACSFRDSYPEITSKNAVVLGISADDVDSHQKFREALNLPFNLLVDEDFKLSQAWECFGTKTYPDGNTFTGIQRAQWVIDENGKIIDAHNPVKATESRTLALQVL